MVSEADSVTAGNIFAAPVIQSYLSMIHAACSDTGNCAIGEICSCKLDRRFLADSYIIKVDCSSNTLVAELHASTNNGSA